MPRTSRMVIKGEKAVYHVISRTALAGLPFGDVEKDEFVKILKCNHYNRVESGCCLRGGLKVRA